MSRTKATITALCGVQFVDVLGVTSAVTAIPATLRGVAASESAAPVLATAYAMCFGGLLVLGARLGDRFGHRRVLLAGVAAFAAVGVLGAIAHSIVQVLAARGLQGAAAAISVPSALRLLLDATPDERARRSGLAAWSASGAAAGALGLLVGGVLTTVLGWRAVFWVNVPVGAVLLVAIRVLAPAPAGERTHLDVLGALLLTLALMGVIVGASERSAPAVATGIVLAAFFVVQQRRTQAPLIPHAALRSPNLRTGTAVSFVNTATTSSAGVLASLLMQQRLGLSSVGAGLALLPFSLSVIAGSALSKRLPLTSRRLAGTGTAGIAAGNLTLALTAGPAPGILAGVAIAGCGLGIASVAATAIGTDVEQALSGTATGVLNTGAQVGTALGVAALLLLADAASAAAAWAVAAALAALTAARALTPQPRATRPDTSGHALRLPGLPAHDHADSG